MSWSESLSAGWSVALATIRRSSDVLRQVPMIEQCRVGDKSQSLRRLVSVPSCTGVSRTAPVRCSPKAKCGLDRRSAMKANALSRPLIVSFRIYPSKYSFGYIENCDMMSGRPSAFASVRPERPASVSPRCSKMFKRI